MFRDLRLKKRQLSGEEAAELLEKGIFGVFSTVGEDGYPYGVPVNYVYRAPRIYFHCAREGKKLDNLRFCDKVSFCVTARANILPSVFSTSYASVVALGRASVVEGAEKEAALRMLIEKYAPDDLASGYRYVEKDGAKAAVVAITVENLCGKHSEPREEKQGE